MPLHRCLYCYETDRYEENEGACHHCGFPFLELNHGALVSLGELHGGRLRIEVLPWEGRWEARLYRGRTLIARTQPQPNEHRADADARLLAEVLGSDVEVNYSTGEQKPMNQRRNQKFDANRNTALTVAEIQQRTKALAIYIRDNQRQLASLLPRGMDLARFCRIAISCTAKNPDLLKCDHQSFFLRLTECAERGLEPNGPLGHAHLVPFFNSKRGRYEVQLIPGYQGLIDLALRSGLVVSIEAYVVYEKEPFDYNPAATPPIRHKPIINGSDRGEVIAAYAKANMRLGPPVFRVVGHAEIEEAKGASKRKGDDAPWITNYAAMAQKTAIRRLAKVLPLSAQIRELLDREEQSPEQWGDAIDVDFTANVTGNGDDGEGSDPHSAEADAAAAEVAAGPSGTTPAVVDPEAVQARRRPHFDRVSQCNSLIDLKAAREAAEADKILTAEDREVILMQVNERAEEIRSQRGERTNHAEPAHVK